MPPGATLVVHFDAEAAADVGPAVARLVVSALLRCNGMRVVHPELLRVAAGDPAAMLDDRGNVLNDFDVRVSAQGQVSATIAGKWLNDAHTTMRFVLVETNFSFQSNAPCPVEYCPSATCERVCTLSELYNEYGRTGGANSPAGSSPHIIVPSRRRAVAPSAAASNAETPASSTSSRESIRAEPRPREERVIDLR